MQVEGGVQCGAYTCKGLRCKRKGEPGYKYCPTHLDKKTGGIKKRSARCLKEKKARPKKTQEAAPPKQWMKGLLASKKKK